MTLRRRRLPRLVRDRVAVHSRDGKSVAGLVIGVYPDALVLSHARLLNDDGNTIPLEGDFVIPLGNVSFLQAGLHLNDLPG